MNTESLQDQEYFDKTKEKENKILNNEKNETVLNSTSDSYDIPDQNTEQNPDDGVFRVPLLPPSNFSDDLIKISKLKSNEKSTLKSEKQPQPILNYTKPNWSSPPPDTIGENKLDEEGFCDHYYLEVIKSGTALDPIKLNKEFCSFGRFELCDVLCEHPSLSRYHAVLQYSDGEKDKNYPQGFYIYDLNSTHGSFVNKVKIASNQYVPLNLDSIIKFGLSTRLYILHGPKSKNNSDDLKINLTHDQMKKIKEKYSQLSLKLRVKRELEEEEEMEKVKEESLSKGVDWGMDLESAENNENEDENKANPFAVIEESDETFYASDPRKALKNYFDREGEELSYETEELGAGKFKCRIQLPIMNQYGEYMNAEVQHDGKKKECMAMCALEACRILNAQGVLKQSREQTAKKKKEIDWEAADYYDSDEDTYLDRTGSIEKKRLKRMAQAGKLDEKSTGSLPLFSKNKVHTFDSLLKDINLTLNEKFEIETKLEKCKAVFQAVEENDLDSYIESLKVGTLDTITRAKFKRRLVEIKSELNKLEKLLMVAKPSNFDFEKWKSECIAKLNKNESIEKTKLVVPTQTSSNEKNPNDINPNEINPNENLQEEIENKKNTIEKTALKNESKSQNEENLLETKSPKTKKIVELTTTEKTTDDLIQSTKHKLNENLDASVNKSSKKQKFKQDISQEDYVDNKDYAVWVPPQDQTGDGKTKLNEKYGY